MRQDASQKVLSVLGDLRAAAERVDVPGLARELVRLLNGGVPPEPIVLMAARWGAERGCERADLALPGVADCARALFDFEGPSRAIPLAQAWSLVSELCAGAPARPPMTPEPVDARDPDGLEARLGEAIGASQGDTAEALALGAYDAKLPAEALWRLLMRLAARHPAAQGGPIVEGLKLHQLRCLAGDGATRVLLPAFARRIALGERAYGLPHLREHAARMGALDGRLAELYAAADPARAATFDEAKFRAHLVDGAPEEAFKAMLLGAKAGVPRALLARSLVLAASERVLRFDPAHDANPHVQEGWLDVTRALRFVSAVRALRTLLPEPSWLRLLFDGARLVSSLKVLDLPPAARLALPEPEPIRRTWDHGPEVTRITQRLLARDFKGALALVRGYFMMMLPEQPLARGLVGAAMMDVRGSALHQMEALATLSAAVDEFEAMGTSPLRELPLASAFRFLTASVRERDVYQRTLEAIDLETAGRRPRSLTT